MRKETKPPKWGLAVLGAIATCSWCSFGIVPSTMTKMRWLVGTMHAPMPTMFLIPAASWIGVGLVLGLATLLKCERVSDRWNLVLDLASISIVLAVHVAIAQSIPNGTFQLAN